MPVRCSSLLTGCVFTFVVLVCALPATARDSATAATAPSTERHSGAAAVQAERLGAARPAECPEAWWTGPVSASSAETLPRGHALVEPYLFNVRNTGSDYIGSLTYLLYGATDRLTIGAIPTFGSARSHGSRQRRRFGVNDLTLSAQYRLNRAAPGELMPTLSLVIQRTLPLGRFDRLGADTDLGIGTGAHGTLFGVYAQRVDWLGSGRPLRTRLNVSYAVAPRIQIDDESIFGTPSGFRGSARPGRTALVDVSVEYSLTRNWVFATDLVYRATGPTSIAVDDGRTFRILPRTRSVSIAPAVEYSWSANRGVLLGVRVTPKGDNVPVSITPVIAFNAVL